MAARKKISEQIADQKQLIELKQEQYDKAAEIFQTIRKMRSEYGGLDEDLENQLKLLNLKN